MSQAGSGVAQGAFTSGPQTSGSSWTRTWRRGAFRGSTGGRISYLSLGGLFRSVTESYDVGGADVGVGVEARERVTALPERGLQDRREVPVGTCSRLR